VSPLLPERARKREGRQAKEKRIYATRKQTHHNNNQHASTILLTIRHHFVPSFSLALLLTIPSCCSFFTPIYPPPKAQNGKGNVTASATRPSSSPSLPPHLHTSHTRKMHTLLLLLLLLLRLYFIPPPPPLPPPRPGGSATCSSLPGCRVSVFVGVV